MLCPPMFVYDMLTLWLIRNRSGLKNPNNRPPDGLTTALCTEGLRGSMPRNCASPPEQAQSNRIRMNVFLIGFVIQPFWQLNFIESRLESQVRNFLPSAALLRRRGCKPFAPPEKKIRRNCCVSSLPVL